MIAMETTAIAVFELIIAVGLVGFWVYFFAVENQNPEKTPVYLAFERSFPLPDLGWLTPALVIAASGLLSGKSIGVVFTIAAGGGLLFLGLLDISFNTQNKGYTTSLGDTFLNITINGVCVIMGPLFIWWGSELI